MDSPRLGVVRDSMLTNPLLIKAPLGQTRSRGLGGPGPDFTFGTSSLLRDGGVADVLSSWRVQPTWRHSTQPVAPDFVALNRDAVRSGLVTSKELSQYRAQRGGARSRNTAPMSCRGGASQSTMVPDITFGVTNRPSSPLADLLSHQYAHRWLDEQLSRSQINNQKLLQRTTAGCIPNTRTSLLRRSRALPVTQTPFKLPPFTQVPPNLDTFRDPKDRLRSFRAHQRDSVSRRGVQDLGPYSLD